MTAVVVPADCPACGCAPVARPGRVRGHALRRCPSCGLQWWDFSRIDPDGLYGETYFRGGHGDGHGFDDYYAMRPAVEWTARTRLGRIAARLKLHGGRLLDVGAGPGFFLHVAREAGWDVRGIEISTSAAQYARETLGLPVDAAGIETATLPVSDVDVVTMWDVLEHVADPAGAFAAAHRALRPGGGLVLTTGDVDSLTARLSGERWHLYNFPEHFYFHTERSLRALATAAGFSVAAVRREPMTVSLHYAIERLRRSYLGGAGRQLGRWLPDVSFPVTLHDVMTLYATKPRA